MNASVNQWHDEWLHEAFGHAAYIETLRRTAINQQIVGGIRLSVRPEAVLRDIQRTWLDAMVPAGVA